MKHIFEAGTDLTKPTLVLFHGTGGTESSLISLGKFISPDSSILSVRGNVIENGMPRFFRRLAEGVFDIEDLILRTKEVYEFLNDAAEQYSLDRNNFVAVGYSNGANIAGSLLFHYEQAFKGAILHHPMVPIRNIALPDQSGIPVFIGAGENDPICSSDETEELQKLLSGAGADIHVHWENYGHQLTRTEADAAAQWFKEHFTP
ncbi:phospholipase/carboxylesterase [Paenibacillus taihuensis]|uniref:Phospholipase/carboxylesterase n=1 Tax=Paenibacillus taihuensis TaxID=1156355 RepID=A0A3D9R2E5_9BACL|nr:alpha/beta hydrolase [Paenibacillus taihuensis]REE68129.1 phospholipase/carboxylesterase [Paenibacillus taihuensis]